MEEYSGGGLTLEKLLLNYCHPIGSLYISEKSTDPSTMFGGTWTQIKDKFILAAGDTYSAGSKGGEATHTLTEAELPKHQHGIETTEPLSGAKAQIGWRLRLNFQDKNGLWENTNEAAANLNQTWTIAAGSGAAHNNMPPYESYYVWKRTA